MSFIVGVDVSLLSHLQDSGVAYREGGEVRDPLAIFRAHGVNFVRLRLFVAPDGTAGQVNDLPYTLALAGRVKAAGLRLLLDLHYSDGWADPEKQVTPAAWRDTAEDALPATVRAYTAEVLGRFRAEGLMPDMVQVGNEITYGMLWPAGANATEAGWDKFARLVEAGIDGTRDGGYAGPIMLHMDQGGRKAVCHWFFDHLAARGVPFDIIGLSYYPFWHGTMPELADTLASLAARHGKPIIVVETGHDWRGDADASSGYPNTPAGQRDYLDALFALVRAVPGGLGAGVFYWAPEWIAGAAWRGPDWSPTWEGRALFDPAGNALPALGAFDRAAGPGE